MAGQGTRQSRPQPEAWFPCQVPHCKGQIITFWQPRFDICKGGTIMPSDHHGYSYSLPAHVPVPLHRHQVAAAKASNGLRPHQRKAMEHANPKGGPCPQGACRALTSTTHRNKGNLEEGKRNVAAEPLEDPITANLKIKPGEDQCTFKFFLECPKRFLFFFLN